MMESIQKRLTYHKSYRGFKDKKSKNKIDLSNEEAVKHHMEFGSRKNALVKSGLW